MTDFETQTNVVFPGFNRAKNLLNPLGYARLADSAIETAFVTAEDARRLMEAASLQARGLMANAAFLALSLEKKEKALKLLEQADVEERNHG